MGKLITTEIELPLTGTASLTIPDEGGILFSNADNNGNFSVLDSSGNIIDLTTGGATGGGSADGNGIYDGSGSIGATTSVNMSSHNMIFSSDGDTNNLYLKADTGRVGIGTALPNSKLQVISSTITAGNFLNTGGGAAFSASTTGGSIFEIVASISATDVTSVGNIGLASSVSGSNGSNVGIYISCSDSGFSIPQANYDIGMKTVVGSVGTNAVFSFGHHTTVKSNADNRYCYYAEISLPVAGGNNYGFYARNFNALTSGTVYGVWSDADSEADYNYGGDFRATGTAGVRNIGLRASATGITASYAFVALNGHSGFGTSTPAYDAEVEIVSQHNDSGVLLPRLTEAQRDAISGGTPSESLMLYNTDTKEFNYYNDTEWVSLSTSGILSKKIILTGTPLRTLWTTPIELIPAAGANRGIEIISCFLVNQLVSGYNYPAGEQSLALANNDLSIFDTLTFGGPPAYSTWGQYDFAFHGASMHMTKISGAQEVVRPNQAIYLRIEENQSGADATTGDGTLEVHLLYRIVDTLGYA